MALDNRSHPHTAIFVANTSWYLVNFRLPLIDRLRRDGWRLIAVSPEDEHSATLAQHASEWRPLRLSRSGKNPVSEVAAIMHLARIYRTDRPALVHHFTIKPVLYGSIAARLARVPAVVNAVSGRGYVFLAEGAEGAMLRALVGAGYRRVLGARSTAVVFENDDDRKEFARLGLVGDNAIVIRGVGVGPERMRATPEPEGEPVALFAGRMLWHKGIGELGEAAALLKQWGVRGRIVLAGACDPGNPAAVDERQLRAWTESGLMTWIGHQPAIGLYDRAAIAVLPSYGEGLPTSLLEAAGCARPIVATDVPGCREIVRHGDNGYLVPPGDPQRLARALQMLFEDPQLRGRMGARGRAIVQAEFTSDHVVAQTMKVYERLLGETKREVTTVAAA